MQSGNSCVKDASPPSEASKNLVRRNISSFRVLRKRVFVGILKVYRGLGTLPVQLAITTTSYQKGFRFGSLYLQFGSLSPRIGITIFHKVLCSSMLHGLAVLLEIMIVSWIGELWTIVTSLLWALGRDWIQVVRQ